MKIVFSIVVVPASERLTANHSVVHIVPKDARGNSSPRGEIVHHNGAFAAIVDVQFRIGMEHFHRAYEE